MQWVFVELQSSIWIRGFPKGEHDDPSQEQQHLK